MKARAWLLAALVVSSGFAGCGRNEKLPRVSLRKNIVRPVADSQLREAPYRIAIAGMSSPSHATETYGPIMDYFTKKLGHPTRILLAHSYADLNKMVGSGEAIGAFVCSGGYVDGRAQFGMELVAAPTFHGEATYYCHIIVPEGSEANKLRDLQGKRFAFTDRDSNTGCQMPAYQVLKMGYRPESFFAKLIYTRNHDLAIAAVRDGIVDGAAVDNLIYEVAGRRDPRLTRETKVIASYGPCASPPVVVHPSAPKEFKDSFKKVLLTMHLDPDGRRLLKSIAADRFVEIQDSAYDSIRVMRRETKAWTNRSRHGDR
ncbi:MAG: phosphate/phosphite/phosphonate ABC transporter substrate-binding protein [Armatimonadota bacterium]|nr:phosphate/phosphite/phosphonate ABC transporter substrate-binding protein [Armatimonadota bacterium]